MLCYVMLCYVMLCVLRLTNIGFVQCFCPRFPIEFVRLCVAFCYTYFASQTSGLCSACTSVPIWNFARVRFHVLRASPRKHQVCAVLFPRPLLSLYACVCHGLLCVLCLTNIGFVQCFSLRIARKFVRVITRQFSFNRDR